MAAEQEYIGITDDGTVPTDYYEVGYKPNDTSIWITSTQNSPLPDHFFARASPTVTQPSIVIGNFAIPLASGITYDVRIKRFYAGGSSNYATTTITT